MLFRSVQARLVPVAEAFDDYVADVAARVRARGILVETDLSDDRFGKKIGRYFSLR